MEKKPTESLDNLLKNDPTINNLLDLIKNIKDFGTIIKNGDTKKIIEAISVIITQLGPERIKYNIIHDVITTREGFGFNDYQWKEYAKVLSILLNNFVIDEIEKEIILRKTLTISIINITNKTNYNKTIDNYVYFAMENDILDLIINKPDYIDVKNTKKIVEQYHDYAISKKKYWSDEIVNSEIIYKSLGKNIAIIRYPVSKSGKQCLSECQYVNSLAGKGDGRPVCKTKPYTHWFKHKNWDYCNLDNK